MGAIALDSGGRIVGEGYKTLLPGTSLIIHAERNALEQAAAQEKKPIVLVTTLEPCVGDHSRQVFSPCADLLIDRGIRTVVIGRMDNHYRSDNKDPIRHLRNRGIEVIEHFELANHIGLELMNPRRGYKHGKPFEIENPFVRRYLNDWAPESLESPEELGRV